MTELAPDPDRLPQGGERELLLSFLDYYRSILLRKLDGVSDADGRSALAPPSILTLTGLDPSCLTLEMRESLLLDNAGEDIPVLRRLGEKGVRIAVDDFGAGRSALAMLRQLPVEALKIDGSLIDGVGDIGADLSMVRAITAMAHSLGLLVSAENVESQAQFDALASVGCDEYQGNLLSEALPEEALRAAFLDRLQREA